MSRNKTTNKKQTGRRLKKGKTWGFPGGPMVKNPPANGDMGVIPGLRRSHMAQGMHRNCEAHA